MQQISDLGFEEEFEHAQKCLDLIDEVWPRPDSSPNSTSDVGNSLKLPNSDSPPKSLGRFRLEHELGRGGGGIVYLATDSKLQREVALKVPHPQFLFSDDLRQRFVAEARLAATLDHPNVVPVYEIGEEGPICFIAAAYCKGPSLASWLEAQEDQIPGPEIARFLLSLTEAVTYAHKSQILHRDLKPSNILLEPREDTLQDAEPTSVRSRLSDFVPKLTDFGLAKTLAGDSHPTRSGAILGTAEYMAPEQASRQLDAIGPTTDVYSIGVILYEMITGTSPFRMATEVETIHKIVFDEIPRPSKLRPSEPQVCDIRMCDCWTWLPSVVRRTLCTRF